MTAAFPRGRAPALLDQDPLYATISEGADAAANSGTRYRIAPDDVFRAASAFRVMRTGSRST
ncbi:hypothetical protein SAMN04487971_10489 [Paracoccus chinensis]|uniref:Uncharacterized protein n=1 Tax=Paracoccus chinensis TaxID=525640 RepID=A0A1G9FTT3_9RHOB|nr:hypothetical protein SAMN04487971_10489 [Paracoccus chinensis]